MSHGLTSRTFADARAEEVKRLAICLAEGVPYTQPVQSAAEALADSIFTLHAIRRTRLDFLTPPSTVPTLDDVERLLGHIEHLESYTDVEVFLLGEELKENFDSASNFQRLLLQAAVQSKARLNRLDEYERKAHSRYLKLVTRLDHLMIEVQRKR